MKTILLLLLLASLSLQAGTSQPIYKDQSSGALKDPILIFGSGNGVSASSLTPIDMGDQFGNNAEGNNMKLYVGHFSSGNVVMGLGVSAYTLEIGSQQNIDFVTGASTASTGASVMAKLWLNGHLQIGIGNTADNGFGLSTINGALIKADVTNHNTLVMQDSNAGATSNYKTFAFQEYGAGHLMWSGFTDDAGDYINSTSICIQYDGGYNSVSDVKFPNSPIIVLGNVESDTVGKGFQTKEGTNAKQGTFTLSSGTVTVANTSVASSSRIIISMDGGLNSSTAIGSPTVTARTAGTSFTITSLSAGATTATGDTRIGSYEIFEPAP